MTHATTAPEALIEPPAVATAQEYTADSSELATRYARLQDELGAMEERVRRGERRRKALLHLIADFDIANKRLARQRKAMLHILADYEQDRRRLVQQADRLDASRRALLHILQDSHRSTLRLEASRKAMIHIMGDLQKTTAEIQQREQELRDKQEQLVQAAKLATLGELTTGVAHELNNPLNNIGLFIGNVIDIIQLGDDDADRMLRDLNRAMDEVHRASQIITHLRTFGRVAPASTQPVSINSIIVQSLSLMHEQLRLRDIEVELNLHTPDIRVLGNAIQLEQVFLNLLTNARDALNDSPSKLICISDQVLGSTIRIVFKDSGPGIDVGFEQRVFDPFFTTKDVGAGTGLGLSITYGIVRDHGGSIVVQNSPGEGAAFVIDLPIMCEQAAGVA